MRSLLLLLFSFGTAFAADPAPVVFPDRAPAPTPTPAPKPVPTPAPKPAVLTLPADSIYVVDYPGDALAIASLPGILKVTTEAGPVKIKGKYADTGKVETRSFTGKTVVTVEALTAGRAELIVIPVGATSEAQIGRKLIDSLTAPVPPPTPPGPKPQPSTAPIAGNGFKVLIVFESQDATRYPAAQQNAIYGADVRTYLNSRCATGPDGKTKEWRIYDQNTAMDGESKVWQDAMKRERKSLPWLILSDGKSGYEGPLPGTVEEIDGLLKKWGK